MACRVSSPGSERGTFWIEQNIYIFLSFRFYSLFFYFNVDLGVPLKYRFLIEFRAHFTIAFFPFFFIQKQNCKTTFPKTISYGPSIWTLFSCLAVFAEHSNILSKFEHIKKIAIAIQKSLLLLFLSYTLNLITCKLWGLKIQSSVHPFEFISLK